MDGAEGMVSGTSPDEIFNLIQTVTKNLNDLERFNESLQYYVKAENILDTMPPETSTLMRPFVQTLKSYTYIMMGNYDKAEFQVQQAL